MVTQHTVQFFVQAALQQKSCPGVLRSDQLPADISKVCVQHPHTIFIEGDAIFYQSIIIREVDRYLIILITCTLYVRCFCVIDPKSFNDLLDFFCIVDLHRECRVFKLSIIIAAGKSQAHINLSTTPIVIG